MCGHAHKWGVATGPLAIALLVGIALLGAHVHDPTCALWPVELLRATRVGMRDSDIDWVIRSQIKWPGPDPCRGFSLTTARPDLLHKSMIVTLVDLDA